MTKQRIIIDTDVGVDDAVAIILAANSPQLEIVALTTAAGNAPVHECTRNALLLCELLFADGAPPVAEGASAPLVHSLLTAPEVHGPDGLGGEVGSLPRPDRQTVSVTAHELLVDLARSAPGEITLVATGPLTNLALALEADPEAVGMLKRVVAMGGAFDVPGNTGPVAEFNFYVDPLAAEIVLRSGLDVTLVPLDVTTRSPLLRRTVEEVYGQRGAPAAGNPPPELSPILLRALDYYMRREREESGLDGGFMHDAIAVAAIAEPELVRTVPARVVVVQGGDDRGRSLRRPNSDSEEISLAHRLDAGRFQQLLRERVLLPALVPGSPRATT